MISQYGNTFFGLSSDDKPTGVALNGRHFEEMDTGLEYVFDAENKLWLPWNGHEETVTGANPEITGAANTLYKCGTVSTISFTPAATGICEMIFTSGATAAVLTLPNTVMMPEWWTGCEANMIYDLSIMDGVYGAVMMWPLT